MTRMAGYISDVKRFAVHDGPGIRTTLFLKGCPLSCAWCHNPESLDMKPSLSYEKRLCVGCGDCVTACARGCHETGRTGAGGDREDIGGHHEIDRDDCAGCGDCVNACMPGALRLYGRGMDPPDAARLLMEDAAFYEQSGGGVTISGGEPLLQPVFCAEVMKLLKARGAHIAVDTCGDVPFEAFERVLPYTDIFLYDVKHIDAGALKAQTGGSAERILDNLRALSSIGKPCELRVPVVPGFNDDDRTLCEIAGFAASLTNVTCVRLLAYHNYSGAKYESLGMECKMPAGSAPPSARRMEEIKAIFSLVCENVRLSGE